MQEILLVILLVVSLALVGVILLQQGKGAGLGASFGAGASGTVFGAPGSATVLTKITTVLAIVFFGIALALASMSPVGTTVTTEGDLFDRASEDAALTAPSSEEIPTETLAAPESDIPTEEKAPEVTPKAKPEMEDKSSEGETKSDSSEDDNKDKPVNS